MPREPHPLSAAQRDRAIGALLATAAGDALGAETPGLWSGHTATAVAVAEIAGITTDLTAPQRLEDIRARWQWWERTTQASLQAAACLTRAVPVALATLDPADQQRAVRAARTLCRLTHAEPDAVEATVLWTLAVRHAVLTGDIDVGAGLEHLDEDRRALWAARLTQAPAATTAGRPDSDDVVAVLQSAYAAITTTAEPQQDPRKGVFAADRLRLAIEAAERAGGHTVAAVAGALVGAAYGASALPWQWRPILRGWPGVRIHGLAGLADKIINGGDPCRIPGFGMWRDKPDPQRHPYDDGVWIGVAARLEKLPEGVEAVVSLCPVADENMPDGTIHLEVRLADGEGANPHLDFVLLDTVRAIEALRADGIAVFLHGRGTRNRAPVLAALYGARRAGIDVDQALADVCAVLPDAEPTNEYLAALHRLAEERSYR